MADILKFYDEITTITVISNGVPIAIEGEVEITVRRPLKQRWNSHRGWNQLAENTVEFAAVRDVAAGERPETVAAAKRKEAPKKKAKKKG